MDLDFPLILVVLTLVTGFVTLVDVVLLKSNYANMAAAKSQQVTAESRDRFESGMSRRINAIGCWVVETSRSFFPVLAIVLVLRSFLVEPFQIPSGSMLPTLEVGDFILVNKYTYGIRLPVAGTKLMSLNDPVRGDVMVFRYPGDRKTNYIKRVVGVAGDKIRYQDKTLYINDEPVTEKHLANFDSIRLFEEQLGEISHQIFKNRRVSSTAGAGEWVVPEGHYFVMGDNRDHSNDSRFWGMVPDELVVGKAFAIWMHWEELLSIPSFARVRTIE